MQRFPKSHKQTIYGTLEGYHETSIVNGRTFGGEFVTGTAYGKYHGPVNTATNTGSLEILLTAKIRDEGIFAGDNRSFFKIDRMSFLNPPTKKNRSEWEFDTVVSITGC